MSPFVLPILFVAVVYGAMVYLNERIDLFRDRFPRPWVKYAAYAWLAIFLLLLTLAIVGSALRPPTAKDLAGAPFYSLFGLHAILIVFLGGWWLMTGRPSLRRFLNIPREGNGEATMIGFAVGVGGWAVTIVLALMVALILQAVGLIPKNPEPSPMIGWMAALPWWKKMLIVLSAMTIEEFFFRAWLQKRIGLIASTVLFALAHAGVGQPLLLIGVTFISLIIGFTFYRTKSLVPCIVAHGVFDAVQLFVIIPIAFKATGLGG